jgi:hypothetical protein
MSIMIIMRIIKIPTPIKIFFNLLLASNASNASNAAILEGGGASVVSS